MEIAKTITEVRDAVCKAKRCGKSVGFVPTMGALHKGHVSLIEAAKKQTDFVVVSIFVNPTQFGPNEDFNKYPRPIEDDLKVCQDSSVDVIFMPQVNEMYPTENITWVNVENLSEPLCGQFRQGHFRGVATVCAKLFNIVLPDMAFFGQKDVQQAIIITRMVKDLNMPLKIVVCPTIRDPDGLAMSSRNKYLSTEQRKQAIVIYKSLEKCRQLVESGIKDSSAIISKMKEILCEVPGIQIEYISVVDIGSLKPVYEINKSVLAAVAVKIGTTRLIDNIMIDLADN